MNVVRPSEFQHFATGADVAPLAWLPLLLSLLRRRWRIIAGCMAACLAGGAAYVLLATPQFTATTQVLIDTRQGSAFQPAAAANALDSFADNAIVDSQVEVLRSSGTVRRVVTTLKLTQDAAFLAWGSGSPRAVLSRVIGLIAPADSGPPTPDDAVTRATERLQSMVAIRRIGLSNVIEIAVQTPSPVRSAAWANALVAAYIDDTLQAKYDLTRKAGAWLQDRLRELRDQSTAADQALVEQKARIGIVDTDKGGMNEQALGDLTLQLARARAGTAETAARYTRIQAITAAGLTAPGSVTDALVNTIILKLQQQYLDDVRKVADWSIKFGPQHEAVISVRREMAALQGSLGNELRRIQQTYQSDYDVARGNEAALQAQIDQLVAVSTATNGARAQTRALESLADTYRTLYGAFLQRYTEGAQDQSFPISQARTISPATRPLHKSAPATLMVLMGAMVAGLGLGFVASVAREVTDRRFQTAAQVRAVTGLDCIGLLPGLPPERFVMPLGDTGAAGRTIPRHPALLRVVVEQPMSGFSGVVRGLRARLVSQRSRGRPNRVIGIVSAAAGEGRSTLAANLAHLLAAAGHRTVLVDWDVRTPHLSRVMAPASTLPGAAGGFDRVARGLVSLDDALWQDAQTSLAFLPAPARAAGFGAERFDAVQAPGLMEMLKARFDFVIVDLPPLPAIADAQTASLLVDGFIVVVEWSKTQQQTLIDGLEAADLDPGRLLGVVLNKVDLAALRRFSAAAGGQYHPWRGEARDEIRSDIRGEVGAD